MPSRPVKGYFAWHSKLHPNEIAVAEICGDQVRIGVRAPRDITVHRREIYDELEAEAQAAKIQSLEVQPLEIG